jgi:hypothetical protein
MKLCKIISIAAVAVLLLAPATAMARTHVNFSLNLFDCLAPMLAPRPIFVAPMPPPVYVAPVPPPVYYVPSPHPVFRYHPHHPRKIVKEYHHYHHHQVSQEEAEEINPPPRHR